MKKGTTVKESLNDIEFAILHISGVYLDILASGVKAFCLVNKINFPLVEYDLDSYSSIEELKTKVKQWNEMSQPQKLHYMNEVVAYYLSPENANQRHKDFIYSLINA